MNNEGSKDTAAFIIVCIVLFIVIAFVIWSFLSSNISLSSNVSNSDVANNSSNLAPNISTNENKISDSDIDNLNVDTDKITIKPNIKTEIASFTSTIYDKDENRVYNITLAISKLNNTIIPKGSEFSFNNTIGPMGESEGYKEAVGFDSDGDKIKIFGGGMCQISSTLYNAALIANLEITERHAHSRRVYYVPKDKDSTILYGSLDLKFINNTDGNIQILASNDKANVTIKLIKIT